MEARPQIVLSLINRFYELPVVVQGLFTALILGLIYLRLTTHQPHAGFPVAKLDNQGLIAWIIPHIGWMLSPSKLLAKGKTISNASGIYQVQSSAGYKLILPRRFAQELRNHKDMDFLSFTSRDFHTQQPGFEPFKEGMRADHLMIDVIRTNLTPSLTLLTQDLLEEAQDSIKENFAKATEADWTTFEIKPAILDIVARESTRIFAGPEMARNKEYVRLTKENTVSLFTAAAILLHVPAFLRHVALWTLPQCRALRKQLADARRLLAPKVQAMEQRRKETAGTGQKLSSKTTPDAFSWMIDTAKGREINYIAGQLMLSMSAIHTTTEMTTRAIMQCCTTPEIVEDLREEMIRVLKEDGWGQTTFYKMTLLDSFLSEVSRHHRMMTVSMGRCVMNEVTLSDGTVLPANSLVMIENDGPNDPEVFPEPDKFDAYRSLRKRQEPGAEAKHQFVTTTSDNMIFGHGQHACPGRFFASNEIKTLICFMLLHFDWRYEPGYVAPQDMEVESVLLLSPNIKVQCRRRQAELDLMKPKV